MKLEVAQKILAATLTHARGRSMQPLAVACLSIAASFSALFARTGVTTISSATAVYIKVRT